MPRGVFGAGTKAVAFSDSPYGKLTMANLDTIEVPEKDLPLRDDIRLLGRILGDTVRDRIRRARKEKAK